MAMREAVAMAALLLLAVLALLPCAAVADDDDAVHRALLDHIQGIRALLTPTESEGFHGERAEAEGEAEEDWLGSLSVEQPAVEEAGSPEAGSLDATSQLFAHIYAVQRVMQEAHEELEDESAGEAVEGLMADGVDGENEVEDDGVVDPLVVQENFKLLEAALKGLKDKDDDSVKELRVSGAEDDGDVNLLENFFAQERHRKFHPDSPSQEPQLEDDQSREATVEHGEFGHGHSDSDGDHEHLHRHDHHHGDSHANAGFSRLSDAHHYKHDHNDHSDGHQHMESIKQKKFMLPEEIAEEEDLLQYGFDGPVHSNPELPSRLGGQDLGVWLRAMGCSLLVSLASLICLMILPCIVSNGKPSETVVNALSSFGAGAMLGDAFLHQLPHAFGKFPQHHHGHGHSHSHSHEHDHSSAASQGHAHSLQDLSIGLAVLGGIILFFIVEKIVRRYEELSSYNGQRALGHIHHHHHQKNEVKKLKGPEKIAAVGEVEALENESKSLEFKSLDVKKTKSGKTKDTALVDNDISTAPVQPQQQVEAIGGFVLGYLNLFSDAVHNFTDGMALGSAFLLHGTVGGWSRTLFLLAHELPQEVGDFGILVKSGFSVFEALAFNFLSALVALAGTAVALILDGSSGHSSLIEGFIAGGFIYISVGGVMPSMHDQGSSLTSTLSQLVPMVFGMGVAVVISLAE